MLQWRNRNLDFSSLEALKSSLRETPHINHLARARASDDVVVLETVSSGDKHVARAAIAPLRAVHA